MSNEAGSSSCELGKGVAYLRGDVIVLEWEKNKYAKEVHLELLGNVKGPLEILGYDCKVKANGKVLSFLLITLSCQSAGAEEIAS